MKLKEVGFSESIQLSDGHWIKAWASVEGDEGDNSGGMWELAKAEVKKQLGGAVLADINLVTSIPVINAKEQPEDSIDTCIAIYSCKELKVLESYKLIVKGKPELQQAYDEMYLKLSQ